MRARSVCTRGLSTAAAKIGFVPSQIYAVGLNYRAHAQEAKKDVPRYPIISGKAVTSVIMDGEAIRIPKCCPTPEVDFEAELGVVVGRTCKDVSAADALSYVKGYVVVNDVSARRWQGRKGGNQWLRAKSFDTFCPISYDVVEADDSFDPMNARITSTLYRAGWDEPMVMQDSTTADMIFSVSEILAHVSQDTTILKDALILTGTPAGVGYARYPPIFLEKGDTIECAIEGLGSVTNRVE